MRGLGNTPLIRLTCSKSLDDLLCNIASFQKLLPLLTKTLKAHPVAVALRARLS